MVAHSQQNYLMMWGAEIARKGNEFGAVTGRPRRCGWFDAVAIRRAIQLNSISGFCMTKLDVLDGFDEVKSVLHTKCQMVKSLNMRH